MNNRLKLIHEQKYTILLVLPIKRRFLYFEKHIETIFNVIDVKSLFINSPIQTVLD